MIYNINMEETQYPKLLSEIPHVDIVIKMGCNVECPNFSAEYIEDWDLMTPVEKVMKSLLL